MSDCVATFAGTDGLASTLQRCYTEAWSIRARPAPVHIASIDFCAGEEQSAERARRAAPCTAAAAAAAARRLAKLRPVYTTVRSLIAVDGRPTLLKVLSKTSDTHFQISGARCGAWN